MAERDFELPDPETLAYTFSEAVADEHGDDAQEYLIRFLDELFQLEPGLRSHFADLLLGELKEEIRRDQGTLSGYPVACIETVERRWHQGA